MVGERIRVSGTVQGVGFRPTVARLAGECGLVGRVWNDAEGVAIEAWAEAAQLDRFIERLQAEPPPLARIDLLAREPIPSGIPAPRRFSIQPSRAGRVRTDIAADAASCPACLAEVMDPANRRYRYPFTNCTHCGPRLSIVRRIPYDRANTSMAAFPMCPACQAEYDDPADRRFHAQPNACPVCGPRVWLEDGAGDRVPASPDCDALEQAARLIRAGRIVAVKGIGGFHLACDAGNPDAVERLRRRKHRYHKPFALMARDLAMVRRHARLDTAEQAELCSPAAPILVLSATGEPLAAALAPGQDSLGFMLPYTPLHRLLMDTMVRPVVLTSGNRSDQPQVTDNSAARQHLAGIADYLLLHDRDIETRLDDSVVRLVDHQPRLLRRARGFAPEPLSLAPALAGSGAVLAMGGELKNSFCLLKDGKAIVSQHIGDLEDAATLQDYRRNLRLYQDLYDFSPDRVAVDRHPNYLSTRLGEALAGELGVPLVRVQHHHAHILSVMAEHGHAPDRGKVLGVALDGLGYGDDGTLWGGEFLLADYRGFERVGHFQPIAMPGGVQAIREPWRNGYAQLAGCIGWGEVAARYPDLDIVRYLNGKPLDLVQRMIDRGLNSPPASSAGRLFDAVAAVLGVCRDRAGYEGQAAIELEALAEGGFAARSTQCYPYLDRDSVLGWSPLWRAILDDLQAGADRALIAARFHRSVAAAVARTAGRLADAGDTDTVVLSGGVVQNRRLTEQTARRLRSEGLQVLVPRRLPANDGGLSVGQAVAASFIAG